jgi:hypothetical protein
MNALYFAVGGLVMVAGAVSIIAWRFRRTIPLEDYKKKYDDL